MAVVVLAAGRSSRMAGGHKLLRPYPDRPIVRRSVQAALAADMGPVGVVVDPSLPAVAEPLADLPVTLVQNPEATRGAATSVRKAAAWAFERADVLVLTLADEPDLSASDIVALYDRWLARPAPAMRAQYRDRPGHPVLITRPFFQAAVMEGDLGLGPALTSSEMPVLHIDAEAPADIDTDTDYQAALARLTH